MCFIITRGQSEIYDILTHLTFLYIEACKIRNRMTDESGNLSAEWKQLSDTVQSLAKLNDEALDRALWNLSKILGRTYQETKNTHLYLERGKQEAQGNSGLFQIILSLGEWIGGQESSKDEEILISFTSSLRDMIWHHAYGTRWANAVRAKLGDCTLQDRPLHVISANLHSILNTLYGYGATGNRRRDGSLEIRSPETSVAEARIRDFYDFIRTLRDKEEVIDNYSVNHGLIEHKDQTGSAIDIQIIDALGLIDVPLHPAVVIDKDYIRQVKPVIIVMDYAFGAQAFEVMDELLKPMESGEKLDFASISIMGKAGTLVGLKGDIMIATAHVLEGTPHNYVVENDLESSDFDGSTPVYQGPMVTVLGTSLQNLDVLEKFKTTSWNAVGLEMEGGHYQRAISAAIIRGHILPDLKVRYAYYASDNPIISGMTLASGSMGEEGILPTYSITNVILGKILNPEGK
ncbi:DUF6909 family protein [Acidobacteriota bacterium]